jgi:HSP20 family protein
MDRMFDNFRTDFNELVWPWAERTQPSIALNQRRTPPMDIADMGDRYEMHLEMPGIPKDDINIEVTPNGVEISAEHDESKEEKDKNWLRRERSNMTFYRSFELPEELKTDNIDAELRDGILKLTLPKVEPKPEHKPKKIKIK